MEQNQPADEISVQVMESAEVQILREKANIDIAISTARAFPRDMQKSLNNSIFTATLDLETASTCGYAVPRGAKSITGPSTHLAKIIMQCWGNFRSEAKVVDETPKHVVSEAIAWDLESNVAVKVTVKRSIMTKTGRMSEDMIVVTGNAANSIAQRNAIFAVIPKAITDKVYKAAQQKIIGDPDKFAKRIKDVLAGYKKTHNKEQADVLSLVGKTDISQVTAEDLVVLIGIAQAIKDGDTTVQQAFDVNKTQKEKVEERKQELKDKAAAQTQQTPAAETKSDGQTQANNPATTDGTLFDAKKEMP